MVKKNLKHFLKGKLSEKEISVVNRGFRILGNLALVEIPPSLKKKEKVIGETILEMVKSVSTVVSKESVVKGSFRTRKTKIIAGKRTKQVVLRENNCIFTFNLDKVFFSDNSSSERKRIASLVKKDEEVMALFSGVAPFNVVISKNSKAKSVYGIELNKFAHQSALENVKLNKCNNIKLFQGDVLKVLPKVKKKFNRVIMHYPGDDFAFHYLAFALKYVKPKGVIHVYSFVNSNDYKQVLEQKLSAVFSNTTRKFKILNIEKCFDIGPNTFKACCDIQVL